ncbi:MAG TPA: universal stress protein, partial [Vicinamibacterales bacterium]|nr:universal stress protein [Vicinamibacterales bacterium]
MSVELRGPILCATDLSDAADAALRQASAIGTQIGAQFHVCHVLPEAFNVRVLFPHEAGVDTAVQAELTAKATTAVRTRLEAVFGAASNDVPVEIETGTAHAGILMVAERLGAGVIVVGPGGTALRVARSAAVPVLVARPSPIGGVVLGATDFSDPSLPAVRMAAAEARRRGVRFRLAHCLDIDQAAYAAGAGLPGVIAAWPLPQSVMDQLEAAAHERLAAALAETTVDAEPLVLPGPPATGILDAAQSVATALIVVGTRGRTGLARLALGSVAESVISGAACS